MMFSRREAVYPKSWAAEISLRRNELRQEQELLRMMARFETDPARRKHQEELVADLEAEIEIVIPPEEIGMKLERLNQ